MKAVHLLFLSCLLCLIFCSCSSPQGYLSSIPCEDITNAFVSEIFEPNEYKSYTADEISFLLGENIHADEISYIYSTDSDDISEIAVFRSSDPEALLKEVSAYADELKSEKMSFVKNYLPRELSVLEGAKVKQFGNYVVLAILDEERQTNVFDTADRMLRKSSQMPQTQKRHPAVSFLRRV